MCSGGICCGWRGGGVNEFRMAAATKICFMKPIPNPAPGKGDLKEFFAISTDSVTIDVTSGVATVTGVGAGAGPAITVLSPNIAWYY